MLWFSYHEKQTLTNKFQKRLLIKWKYSTDTKISNVIGVWIKKAVNIFSFWERTIKIQSKAFKFANGEACVSISIKSFEK